MVLSAPSGAGKTAIAEALLATEPVLERSISVTTRERRPSEIDGVHYHFLSEAGFQQALLGDELLEWARVLQGTHAYGTPRAPVEKALDAGRDVVFDIDWQGHRQLREKLPADVVSVFVLPPNVAALRSRLVGRAGDHGEEIERRMRVATEEIRHWVEFDHVVVNEDLCRRDRNGARGAACGAVGDRPADGFARVRRGAGVGGDGPPGIKTGSRLNRFTANPKWAIAGSNRSLPIRRRNKTRAPRSPPVTDCRTRHNLVFHQIPRRHAQDVTNAPTKGMNAGANLDHSARGPRVEGEPMV